MICRPPDNKWGHDRIKFQAGWRAALGALIRDVAPPNVLSLRQVFPSTDHLSSRCQSKLKHIYLAAGTRSRTGSKYSAWKTTPITKRWRTNTFCTPSAERKDAVGSAIGINFDLKLLQLRMGCLLLINTFERASCSRKQDERRWVVRILRSRDA